MRFSTLIILICLALSAVASGLNCYAAPPSAQRVRMVDYKQSRSSPDIEQSDPWGHRFAQHDVRLQDPHDVQSTDIRYPRDGQEQQSVHYGFPQMGMNDDWSTDFDWSRFTMALVLLAGGTLVCRRIFSGASATRRQPQLRQPARPQVQAPPLAPPPAKSPSRMCPRADCGRMNPPMAKFCRRCGAALSDA